MLFILETYTVPPVFTKWKQFNGMHCEIYRIKKQCIQAEYKCFRENWRKLKDLFIGPSGRKITDPLYAPILYFTVVNTCIP